MILKKACHGFDPGGNWFSDKIMLKTKKLGRDRIQ
jgi:hypothetical protein